MYEEKVLLIIKNIKNIIIISVFLLSYVCVCVCSSSH